MSLIRLSRRACGKLRLLRRGARAYSDDANPIAKHIFPRPVAKTAASEPATTNTWLLHPWLPIDVRWLTALGAGLAAAYWMGLEYLPEGVSLPQLPQLQQLPELKLPSMPNLPWNTAQAPPPPPQEVILTEGKDGLEARPSPSTETSGPVPTAEEPNSESAVPPAQLVDEADGGSAATAVAEPEEHPEEPEVVDPVPVQDLINEVLAGTSYTAPGEQPSLEGGKAVAAREERALEAEAPHPVPPPATSVEVLEQQLEALRAPIQGKAGVTDEEAAAHRQRPEVIRSKGLLGMADNITTADLVEQAIQHGLGSKDWAAFEAAHRQAVADARTFRDILRRAQDYHQEELASAYSVAERWAQRAEETMTKAEENIELFRGLLQYQRRLAEQHKEYELELQRSSLFKEHAQMLVRERSNRMMLLEAVRKEVNVVSATLDSVGQRLKDGAASSRIRTGLHILLDRSEAGQPFQDQLAQLQRAAQDDSLLQAALASIPAELAQEGLRTPGQLQEGWSSIKPTVQLNGILPEGGGMLSLLVARLAAALKLSERRYVELGMGSTSRNTCVAAVERHVMEGRFRAAALELEELLGPGAIVPGSAVHRWIKAAKSRALLDQAVTLLKAHATALSTSVA